MDIKKQLEKEFAEGRIKGLQEALNDIRLTALDLRENQGMHNHASTLMDMAKSIDIKVNKLKADYQVTFNESI